MPKKIRETEFERIAKDAIRQAELVECSLAEFAEGLKLIEDEIRDRREANA